MQDTKPMPRPRHDAGENPPPLNWNLILRVAVGGQQLARRAAPDARGGRYRVQAGNLTRRSWG